MRQSYPSLKGSTLIAFSPLTVATFQSSVRFIQWSYAQFLLALCETEAQRRSEMRLKRAITEAQLPGVKSFTTFEFSHCQDFNPAPLMQLADETGWIERAENCFIFGASGVGKTHLASALSRHILEAGKRVKFFSATASVQLFTRLRSAILSPTPLTFNTGGDGNDNNINGGIDV